MIQKEEVEIFFKNYVEFFMESLNGEVDSDKLKSLYANEFIAASPMGVMTGKNDNELKKTMEQGYEYYRQIGTKEMIIRRITISPVDDIHCIAHVSWTAVYVTKEKPKIEIDFDVHYLMQKFNGSLRIFGWISGDEQQALKENNVI